MTSPGEKKEGGRLRVTVRYEGRVQGVGFRFTALEVARDFDIAGFVQNEDGGSVLLVVEGREKVLCDYLAGIRGSAVGRFIAREQADWSLGTGEFSSFAVRRGY
jgi:acylphosphatase